MANLLPLDFISNVLHNLSQVYMTVFVLVAMLVGSIISLTVCLSKKPTC